MPMYARWPSTCSICNKPISVGQPIGWPRKTVPGQKKSVYHSACRTESKPETIPAYNHDYSPITGEPMPKDNDMTPKLASNDKAENSALQILASAMLPWIEEKIGSKVDAETVRTLVEKTIEGKLTQRIVIENRETGEVKELKGLQHNQFADVLKAVQTGINVYLYDSKTGGPGSGKSTMAHMIADALGLPFYHISLNVQSQPSLIMGFINATGKYMQTDFRTWYELGGVFFFDEIDNVNGNFLTSLNTSLANGSCSFPDGMVARHKDAYCIAAGNTSGSGASSMHNSRQVLDSASRERFAFIPVNYDETLERTAAIAHNADAKTWIDYVQATRKTVRELGVKMLVTPRASIYGAQLLKAGFKPDAVADMVLFKGIDADTRQKVLNNSPLPKVGA